MQVKGFWQAEDRAHRRVKRVGLAGLLLTLGIGGVLVAQFLTQHRGDPAGEWYVQHLEQLQAACTAAGYERLRPRREGPGLVLEPVGAGDAQDLRRRVAALQPPAGIAVQGP